MQNIYESSTTKRRYSSYEESSDTGEENAVLKEQSFKKPLEKKIKERTSPDTTDSECNTINRKAEVSHMSVSDAEMDQIVSDTECVSLGSQPGEKMGTNKNIKAEVTDSSKDDIKDIDQLWSLIDGKRNISSIGNKGPRESFLYDFLGEEVDKDEAAALEALNFYWLNTVAKSAAKPRTDIPDEHKDFYNRYCNGTRQLSAESAMRLMSLPHVVAVSLKSNAQIEVVVSEVDLALQDSPGLHHKDFEVVEAMGMHLF